MRDILEIGILILKRAEYREFGGLTYVFITKSSKMDVLSIAAFRGSY
jgi:hypothetical protein